MKKIILLSVLLLILGGFLFSQTNLLPTSGNVGIGTNSPTQKLQVIGGKIFIGNPSIVDSYDQLYSAGGNPGFRQEVQRPSGGAAFDFINAYAHKTGAMGDALWGKIGILGDFGNVGVDAPPVVNYIYFGAGPNTSYWNNAFRLYPNGTAYFNDKVGIGTAAPASLFDVFGKTAGGNVDINFRNQPGVNTSGTRINLNFPVFNGAPGLQIAEMSASTGGFNVGTYDALISTGQNSSYLHLAAGSARTPQISLKFTGDVGIGTVNPNAKLDVNGSIYANVKIYIGVSDANTSSNMGSNLLAVNGSALFNKVTVKAPLWPDYVFSSTYQLTPLDSLEQFIRLNGHLPEVPKAEEIVKNGVDLGSNQALLLKKIEELTLIVIEQNKEKQNLKKSIDELNKRIEKLETNLNE